MGVAWDIAYTDEAADWVVGLDAKSQRRVLATIEFIAENGPGLGRPTVDTIRESRHANMKEARIGTMRVLFAFDRNRVLIVLVGGDKHKRWNAWYRDAIPHADDLLDAHLTEEIP